ncbi:MAG TPA: carbohydrate ABC transporter permease [Eubacteriales bacterium]|nr:carbohydrate ABC transporter permease [Eubacteriales bacterium]
MKSTSKKRAGGILAGILIALFMVLLIFPFYWIFITSVKPESELYGAVVTYWPHHITFQAYRELFESFNFIKYMKNSLIVAVVTTCTTLVLALLAAYAFCRFRFPGRKFLMGLFLCNNMFPTVLLLIPLYAIMRQWGVLYTPTALILAYTTFTLPFCVWLLNGYIKDTPVSLEEAAQIDGCNRYQAFMKVFLPIMKPCLVATGVYIFMQAWNEYTYASLLSNADSRTITVALKTLIGQLGVQWDMLTAGGIISVVPVCIMFFFAQKRLIEGLTAGAVKG